MNDLASAINTAEKAIREVADELREREDPVRAQRLRTIADQLRDAIRDSLSQTKETPEMMAAIERARVKLKR